MKAFRYNSVKREDRKFNNCTREKNPNAIKFYASNMDYANNYKYIHNEAGDVIAECALEVVKIENVKLFDMPNDFKSLATYNDYIASEIGAQMRDYTRFMNEATKPSVKKMRRNQQARELAGKIHFEIENND